nr:hypothetical protein BHI3_07790 [Bacteriovorax sp. HI3]
METIIVNEKLVSEFEDKVKDPIIELQFKGGVSYGTAYTFLKTKTAPRREKTRKMIAEGLGAKVSDLFKVSRTAS